MNLERKIKSIMEFNDFHKWVHREYGMNLSAYKSEQLNRRISSLMGRLDISSLEEYRKIIVSDSEQRERFFDFITINVTEFFRNPELFKELEQIIKKSLIHKNESLKIWSAACSIGCEPYSLAIMLDKLSVKNNVKIIATDIDRNALAKAEKGVYTLDEIKNVKKEDLDKYFEKIDDNYCVGKNIKSMVTFRKHDLITEKYEGGFDLIVCRNVVIYFKSDAKMEVYSKLAGALNKGGFLFVGGTESIYDYKKVGLERVSTFIYKKL